MPFVSRHRSSFGDLLSHDARNRREDGDGSLHFNGRELRPSTAAPVSSARLSTSGFERPETPPLQQATPATRRFSMLRFRHFSDSHLASTARMHALQEDRPPVPDIPDVPPLPPAPSIITTAPTMELPDAHPPKKQKTPFKRQMSKLTPSKHAPTRTNPRAAALHVDQSRPSWRKSFERKDRKDNLRRMSTASVGRFPTAPPAYGDDANSALALPVERLSESSGGDRSSGEHVTYATTTTTHTISTTTTLFKLPRRNKKKSLFPLPIKIEPPSEHREPPPATPRASTSAISTRSNVEDPTRLTRSPISVLRRRHTEVSRPRFNPSPDISPIHHTLAMSAVGLAAHGSDALFRNDSSNSTHSSRSSPALAPPKRFTFRDRSSTTGSMGRPSEDMTPPTPPLLTSARNSTSTSGRTSLGGFLGLNRFRHNSESQMRNASPGTHSKSNSLVLSQEALNVPEREEGDTPGRYLERLQATVSRSLIAGILSKSSDPFAQSVLRSYSRKFSFFGEPIDMSLRKFLLEAELPKETQQVDRVIQAFADRYHECNPGIFQNPDKAYIIAFSIMMLHTDAFNKNNKRKMQKQDYVKNTSGQNVSDDVLACFYDNICYTPFIHFDEEVDINGERLLTFKPKKSKLRSTIPDPVRKTSGPIDPYALICEGKLDTLRPPIKEIINMDDPYTYLGTAGTLDIHKLQKAFINTGVLQIISARSRPAAFESQATRDNPSESAAGVVDLKVTKVGIIWRKSAKRKKTRSPWQEWGAILTGSQLYLFKNLYWVKSLMAQQQSHNKYGSSSPVIFKPPIQDFKPDAMIKTDDAVALVDTTYTRHKDAFTLVRHGGHEEVLIAENEAEMNDWISLLNYAAAFRSAGVRIRGFIGGTDVDSSGAQSRVRLNSISSVAPTPRADAEATSPKKTNMTPELVQQVLVLRGKIMRQTIVDSEREIEQMTNSLDIMLRNARHLLLLAPIQQKTREDICHAAARMNAMLKWVRRDIWRIKCHRDILARDLELDYFSDLREKPGQPQAIATSAAAVHKASGFHALTSMQGSVISPPQSPKSTSLRPAVTSPADEYFSNDVFHTPLEQPKRLESLEDWKLPHLDLNPEQNQQRLSVASAGQSIHRKHSAAGMSTTSSTREGPLSSVASDTPSRPGGNRSIASYDGHDFEALILARDGLVPTVSATTASSAGAPHAFDVSSPLDSASKPKNRRSLHRTLRDSRHEPSSIHRHRKGKESGSTIKSDGTRTEDTLPEAAPVLERADGKFTVHGKQASVVTFGGDWAAERLRLKQQIEVRSHSSIDTDESGPDANLRRHVQREIASSEGMDDPCSNGALPGTIGAQDDEHFMSEANPGLSKTISPIPHGFAVDSDDDDVSTPNMTTGRGSLDDYFGFTTKKTTVGKEDIGSHHVSVYEPSGLVSPRQIPLPVSPRLNIQDDFDSTTLEPRHINDEDLRSLSQG